MTAPRRRSLQIDDPLGPAPGQPSQGMARPDASADASPETNRDGQVAAAVRASTDGVWRAWSGITGVGSFRLPHELLSELGDTARELRLPIGMIVTAAITELLDQPPDTIAALVDRADDARIQGRRQARRHRTEAAGD